MWGQREYFHLDEMEDSPLVVMSSLFLGESLVVPALFRGVPPKTYKQFDLLWDDLIRERDRRSCIALIGRNFRGSELVELGMI